MQTAAQVVSAGSLHRWGAFAFGLILGWTLYFLNRYRKDVVMGDLSAVIGALGGAAVLSLFPAGTDLFAMYGLGLAAGFFLYFVALLLMVASSDNFSIDYFIDGRKKDADGNVIVPGADEGPRRSFLHG